MFFIAMNIKKMLPLLRYFVMKIMNSIMEAARTILMRL
jgi:hypothetical protein